MFDKEMWIRDQSSRQKFWLSVFTIAERSIYLLDNYGIVWVLELDQILYRNEQRNASKLNKQSSSQILNLWPLQ